MPSLIDLRRRIRSVKNTQQITKAMKMVSAAKLRRAQDRVISARPYAASLREMLSSVTAAVAGIEGVKEHPLLARRKEERVLLLLLTSDRGLAGAFNSNLIRAAQQFLDERPGISVHIEALGRKGRDYFSRRHGATSDQFLGIFNKTLYSDAVAVAGSVVSRYQAAETDAAYLLFNEFRSVLSQKLTLTRLLPLELPQESDSVEYIFEQPPQQLLGVLLPRYVEIQIYQAVLESSAAEHAARMTAMEAATNNAVDVIDRLTLHMNRVRQASITKEIIEIVSGAAALE